MVSQEEKGLAFRALHEGEPFVIPNPWDVGSARVLEALGFEALATTSSGFAFTLGRLDGQATLDDVVAHVAELDRATGLPVSVDLENGYATDAAGVAHAIERMAPAHYLESSYYEHWLHAIERLLVEKGTLSREEIAARMAELAKEDA